ncbi:MAG: aminotransferase class V-fold PLP-dependent enzyme [Candidatus Melainabacteria bacterium]|nr:aminotransferase class V-fold PLP-dependent enzyme [Candidatus Melainabacteria bacterium]
MFSSNEATVDLNVDLLRQEFPLPADGSIYLNSGSCGRKPERVLTALRDALHKFNTNPTRFTFIETSPLEEARAAAVELFGVGAESLLLTNSTSQGLQLVMQSFLAGPDDELVTTTHEHGVTRTICRYLHETRGVRILEYNVEPLKGSMALCKGILNLVSNQTRLVQVSEIDCYSGWRPNLKPLVDELARAGIPLLVDGAHSPGQGLCRPAYYPLWVGSGHKWLGGPNGTGFLYARKDLIPQLKPLWLADCFYNFPNHKLARFEFQGTGDMARWLGLAAAIRLNLELNPEVIAKRQLTLKKYLCEKLKQLPGQQIQTPYLEEESSGMVTVTWEAPLVTVSDLRQALWDSYQIWVQPDYLYGQPEHGMRVSCHPATTEEELDKLVLALSEILQ